MFDFYTYEKLKGYYPLYWYGKFYDLKNEVRAENDIENVHTLCGVDENGKALCIVTYYTDDDNAVEKSFAVDFGRSGKYEIYLLDESHDGELVNTTDALNFTMQANTCIMIKEI